MDQGTSSDALAEQALLQTKLNKMRCPQPLSPTVANAQINYLNQQMQTQSNGLQSLNKQIADIESRYMIQFNAGNANNYLNNANNVKGGLTISGNIPNPQLNFNLIPPLQGMPGPRGPAGQQGPSGFPGIQGSQGPQGYWGIQGK